MNAKTETLAVRPTEEQLKKGITSDGRYLYGIKEGVYNDKPYTVICMMTKAELVIKTWPAPAMGFTSLVFDGAQFWGFTDVRAYKIDTRLDGRFIDHIGEVLQTYLRIGGYTKATILQRWEKHIGLSALELNRLSRKGERV